MDENIKKIFGWKYEKGLKMLEISLVAYLYIIVYKKKKKNCIQNHSCVNLQFNSSCRQKWEV